jgi:hypothetical protein
MSEIEAYGLGLDPPSGWELRIFRRTDSGGARAMTEEPAPPGALAPPGAVTLPVVQVSTIQLPPDAADYGSDIVEDLGPQDALVVLKEFLAEASSDPLFELEGMPRTLDPEAFSPSVLQRSLEGQAGVQVFFHEADRAFCLYVVLGSFANRSSIVSRVNEVLGTMRISGVS